MQNDVEAQIIVEKETVSDSEYLITEIYIESGSKVEAGELVFSFETSKADIDVEAPADGYLFHKLSEGDHVEVGDVIGIITSNSDTNVDQYPQLSKNENRETKKGSELPEGVRFSKKAEELIEKHGLNTEVFKNSSLVREKDVLEILGAQAVKSLDLPKSTNDNDVLIIGGSGGGKMCIDAIRSTNTYSIAGIIDDNIDLGNEILEIPVVGNMGALEGFLTKGYNKLVLAFGVITDRNRRYKKYQELKQLGFEFPNIVHSKAAVEPSADMGEGNVILATALVGSEGKIGNLNYINTGSMLCHEAVLEDNVHLAPGSVVGGRAKIGTGTLLGMNATVFFEATIGKNVTVNNGINIYTNIDQGEVVKS